MVVLQGLHSGDVIKCPSISGGVGLKSFHSWCLKLGGNMEMIHLHEVQYQMAIACDICWAFASMTVQNILDHRSECKEKCDKECMEHNAHEVHGKAHIMQDSKKESKSYKLKKGQKGASETLGSGECGSTKDAAMKSCWVECHSMSFSIPTHST